MKFQTYESEVYVCCQDMMTGLNAGTDGEGYGAVIWYIGGNFLASEHPTKMQFCPWCGTKLNEKTMPKMPETVVG